MDTLTYTRYDYLTANLRRLLASAQPEYRKDPRGFIVRITPRRFRRGRCWRAGKLVRPERWKVQEA